MKGRYWNINLKEVEEEEVKEKFGGLLLGKLHEEHKICFGDIRMLAQIGGYFIFILVLSSKSHN